MTDGYSLDRRDFIKAGLAGLTGTAGCLGGDGSSTPSGTEENGSDTDDTPGEATGEDGTTTDGRDPTSTDTQTSTGEISYSSTTFAVPGPEDSGVAWEQVERDTFDGDELDEIVYAMIDVGPLAPDEDGNYAVNTTATVSASGETVQEDSQEYEPTQDFEDDTVPFGQFPLDISELEGQYNLEVSLTDRYAETTATAEDSFTVQ